MRKYLYYQLESLVEEDKLREYLRKEGYNFTRDDIIYHIGDPQKELGSIRLDERKIRIGPNPREHNEGNYRLHIYFEAEEGLDAEIRLTVLIDYFRHLSK